MGLHRVALVGLLGAASIASAQSGVRGVIVDEQGKPLPKASVSTPGPRSKGTRMHFNNSFQVPVDAQGKFEYPVQGDTLLLLLVTHPNRVRASRTLEIPAKGWLDEKFVLGPASTLSGQVVDPNGKAVADPVVYGSPCANPKDCSSETAHGNASGLFVLEGMPPGNVTLTVQATGYRSVEQVVIAPSKEPVRVVLQPGQAISGKVLRKNKSPAAGVKVFIWDVKDPNEKPLGKARRMQQSVFGFAIEPVAVSAADGSFSKAGFRDGAYEVWVEGGESVLAKPGQSDVVVFAPEK